MVTFSLMAGIFHEYYTVALAPAVAALVGMGAAEAWEHRARSIGSITLAAATAAAATWSFILLSRSDWQGWLRIVVLALGLASALLLLAVTQLHRRFVPVVIAGALVAALAGPAAYSVQTVGTAHTGSIVTAGPTVAGARGGGIGGLLNASTPNTEVVSALSADAGSYRWVAAAIGSQNAAGLQLGTGLPVMAIGGFNGSDPSPTLAQFQQYVADGDIHYFVASGGMGGGPGGGMGGGMGGSGTGTQISAWVAASVTQVTIGGTTFYDLTQPLSSTGATDLTGATSETA
jgi:hypothetical protein